jgi:hypothetical protein
MEHLNEPFVMDLDGGTSVHADGTTVQDGSGAAVPVVSVRMPVARAHALAHLIDEWSRAFRLPPDKPAAAGNRLLAGALEAAAAAWGEPGALRCAARIFGEVTVLQRLAAVGVLVEREERLSALQRFAVVDSAARWLREDDSEEMALALLGAACSTDATAHHVYLALLSPPGAVGAS